MKKKAIEMMGGPHDGAAIELTSEPPARIFTESCPSEQGFHWSPMKRAELPVRYDLVSGKYKFVRENAKAGK
jgi:hypothetical protein